MIEQEIASIAKFVLACTGNPEPYYWNIPENFYIPAAYFPIPEIDSGGDTLSTYSMDFAWYINLFHKTDQKAYALGRAAITAIREARNLIPLISEDGEQIEKMFVRVNDPKLKGVDTGVVQLSINWCTRRLYKAEDANSAQSFNLDLVMKSGREISDVYAEALEKYAVPLGTSNNQLE